MKHIIAQVLYTPADFYPIFLEYRYKNISFAFLFTNKIVLVLYNG